jgi:hypothetical protein
MSSVRQYWEKYRERKKSPGGSEVFENLIANCANDRISELQSQVNILEDRLVNLSRQLKLQKNEEAFNVTEVVNKLTKIDQTLDMSQKLAEKVEQLEELCQSLCWSTVEGKIQVLVKRAEERVLKHVNDKLDEFQQKLKEIDGKIKKSPKKEKYEELINKKFDDLREQLRRTTSSKSSDNLKRKLQEFEIVQDKIQKIVVDTAEKVKKRPPSLSPLPPDSEKFSKAIDKIGNLLKKYSKAQDLLFTNFKSLEEKTRLLEEKFEISHSFAVSEPVHRQPSFSSFSDNFKISFGSEDAASFPSERVPGRSNKLPNN